MKTLFSILTIITSLTYCNAQGYLANLDGAQDGGGLRQGSGSVNITLSGTTMSFSGSYSGLTVNSSAGHIHGPSGSFPATGSVRYDLGGLGVLSLGGTSGTFNGNITLGDLGAYTLAQQLSDLNSGLWYINIHNSSFPGGEIRGVITAVPEPTSLALLGLSGLGFLFRSRNLKR